MRAAIVLFTRDLRVHDHPALAATVAAARYVVPLFVHDPSVRTSANRDRFLAQSLADLAAQLRERGGVLIRRTGDPVAEALRLAQAVGAEGIALSADASRYARRRYDRLVREAQRYRIAVREFPGAAVVQPGSLRPSSGGPCYRVFTPYWRAWRSVPWRSVLPAPARVPPPPELAGVPPGGTAGVLADQLGPTGGPDPGQGAGRGGGRGGGHGGALSPAAMPGGEAAARARLAGWTGRVDGYPGGHDDLAGAATSGLSPYLHFGCLSPGELAAAVPGAEAFLRQLCWRDFYLQLLASFPDLAVTPLREPAVPARDDAAALDRWRHGHTGVPVVDAGMRQLAEEGFMHNRARLITASFLCQHLGLDWRAGAAAYAELLLDADVASNNGNWQWVAGTGTDTKPYRRFNPIRQAYRFDPDGGYVRRYVPELAGVPGGAVHEPWRLSTVDYPGLRGYPAPLPGVAPATWYPPG